MRGLLASYSGRAYRFGMKLIRDLRDVPAWSEDLPLASFDRWKWTRLLWILAVSQAGVRVAAGMVDGTRGVVMALVLGIVGSVVTIPVDLCRKER